MKESDVQAAMDSAVWIKSMVTIQPGEVSDWLTLPDLSRASREMAAKQAIRIAALEAEKTELLKSREWWCNLAFDLQRQVTAAHMLAAQQPAAFGLATDIPAPSRRPDGTLAPTTKPWTAPKPAGDPRRIGS